MSTDFVLSCPHCKGTIIVNESEIHCAIFRHAILVSTGEQISPHASKAVCDELVAKNAVRGCGGPFRVVREKGKYVAVVCDYI